MVIKNPRAEISERTFNNRFGKKEIIPTAEDIILQLRLKKRKVGKDMDKDYHRGEIHPENMLYNSLNDLLTGIGKGFVKAKTFKEVREYFNIIFLTAYRCFIDGAYKIDIGQ